ncbi:MAG: hypothetical protein HY815_32970 [Candidatus Riflebacteria bacterium]|nr:hypothetical protein [Candidatus Riflebacteria bacterium]
MLNVPRTVDNVLNDFFTALKKKDDGAIFKLFAQDGMLIDFEGTPHRTGALRAFFRDWPPPSMQVRIEKQQPGTQSAVVTLSLLGGAFSRVTQARATFTLNEKLLIFMLKFELLPR